MQQTTSASANDGSGTLARFRPTLVYSADGERRTVDEWMRGHGLWRTSLYHLLDRNPALRVSIEGDELAYRPTIADGFAVRLARDGDGWIVHAGGLTARLTDASHAAGIFCAAVSGALRIVVRPLSHGLVEQRMQLADAGAAWLDVVVAREPCASSAGTVLANPALVAAG